MREEGVRKRKKKSISAPKDRFQKVHKRKKGKKKGERKTRNKPTKISIQKRERGSSVGKKKKKKKKKKNA